MQRQRGELVPIGDALSGMGGPVKSIREATPRRCTTSPLPIKCTSLSRPARRPPISASWLAQ